MENNINSRDVVSYVKKMYKKYGVDSRCIIDLTDDQIVKGMKGVLAELDLNKKREYEQEDLFMIKKIYSMFC